MENKTEHVKKARRTIYRFGLEIASDGEITLFFHKWSWTRKP